MQAIALQWSVSRGDPDANMARLDALLRAAAPEPGDLVVIPELWPTGYSRRASLEATVSAHGGRWSSFVAGIARERGVFIAGSAPHGEDGHLTNRLVVYGPSGDSMGFYDKMHLFPPMREDELFSAGGKVETIPLPDSGFILGPAICYDLRFPELFRLLALRGATLFVLPSEFPDPKEDLWHVFLASRAAENQAYVVACNRTGEAGAFTFFGSSAVYDPLGRCLGRLGREEGYLKVPIDASEVVKARASLEVLARVRLSIGV